MNRSDWWLPAAGIVLLAGCHADATTNTTAPLPPAADQIAIVSGDAQDGDPLDQLDDSVRFQVLDGKGHPLAHVAVTFAVPLGGGTVPSATAITDTLGQVVTAWTMGATGGVQTLLASVATPSGGSPVSVTAHATTCPVDACYPPEVMSNSLNDATLLSLATYDSSGQTVHPDVVRGHGAMSGLWLAITPYPGGQSQFENPSIYHSTDAQTWTMPAGASNPVARPFAGYNSDPDLIANNDHRLWLYYRSVISAQNIVFLTRSGDGVSWDVPTTVITVPSHMLVSPSVVRGAPQARWQMWSVNAGPAGCSAPTTTVERRTSTDGINWGAPVTASLVQPGRAIWHIDVEWIPARHEYWALYNTYAIGTSCTTDALFLARSPDGINWTVYPSPIARAGVTAAFKDVVYRSTLLTDLHAQTVTLWISGASFDPDSGYRWQTATVSTSVDNLLAIAAAPSASLDRPPGARKLPPPEPDVAQP